MKRIICFIIVIFQTVAGFGQGSDLELLSLDIEKLAQMKAMLHSMYDGYNILSKGYGQITSLVRGNFDLHKAYLDRLSQVSPAVKKYQKVRDIIANQAELIAEFTSSFSVWQSGGWFRPTELMSIRSFGEEILDKGAKGLDELQIVVTAGEVKMNDGERIGAIDGIDKGLNEQIAMMRNFIKVQNQLADKRKQLQREIEMMRKLNGLN